MNSTGSSSAASVTGAAAPSNDATTGLFRQEQEMLRRGFAIERSIAERVRRSLSAKRHYEPRYSSAVMSSVMRAFTIAAQLNHAVVDVPHLLAALAAESAADKAFQSVSKNYNAPAIFIIAMKIVSEAGSSRAAEKPTVELLPITPELRNWINVAAEFAKASREQENWAIQTADLLIAAELLPDLKCGTDQLLKNVLAAKTSKPVAELMQDLLCYFDSNAPGASGPTVFGRFQMVEEKLGQHQLTSAMEHREILAAIGGVSGQIGGLHAALSLHDKKNDEQHAEHSERLGKAPTASAVAACVVLALLIGSASGFFLQP